MRRLTAALSMTAAVVAVLFWAGLSWTVVGVAEWDGRHEADSGWAVAVALTCALGSAALVFAVSQLRHGAEHPNRLLSVIACVLVACAGVAWIALATVLAY